MQRDVILEMTESKTQMGVRPGVSYQIGVGMESENSNFLLRFCQIQTRGANVFTNCEVINPHELGSVVVTMGLPHRPTCLTVSISDRKH